MALPNYEKNINKEIQSGSNSNGKYIKFPDGTLIQYGSVSVTPSTQRLQGGLTYYSGAIEVSLPEKFINTNYNLSSNIILANMNYFCQSYCVITSNSSITISFASTGKDSARTIQWIAIGRWK